MEFVYLYQLRGSMVLADGYQSTIDTREVRDKDVPLLLQEAKQLAELLAKLPLEGIDLADWRLIVGRCPAEKVTWNEQGMPEGPFVYSAGGPALDRAERFLREKGWRRLHEMIVGW